MAWDKTKPADADQINNSASDLRGNYAAIESGVGFGHDFDASTQTGEHNEGAAKIFGRTTKPTKKEDNSTALAAADNNRRLWLDTTNSLLKVLTSAAGGTWTSIAQFLGMLDEDDLVSNSNTVPATQQSIKAYIVSGTVTMTNKTLTTPTLTSPVINTGVSGSAVDTDGTLAANSDTILASQKATKTYVDTVGLGADLMHDAEGGYDNVDVDGTKTKVYTKYFTGTLDADSETSVAHGITGIDKILAVSAVIYHSTELKYLAAEAFEDAYGNAGWRLYFDGTNVIITGVGSVHQGQKYRIKIDYIL